MNVCRLTRRDFSAHVREAADLPTGSIVSSWYVKLFIWSHDVRILMLCRLARWAASSLFNCFFQWKTKEKTPLTNDDMEIYEWVNLVVTLCSEAQQVVILLCPQKQTQVHPTVRGEVAVDSGQWRKMGGRRGGLIHAWTLPAQPYTNACTRSTYEHKKSIFQHQVQTRSFDLTVFFPPQFVRETEASEDNSSVTHI